MFVSKGKRKERAMYHVKYMCLGQLVCFTPMFTQAVILRRCEGEIEVPSTLGPFTYANHPYMLKSRSELMAWKMILLWRTFGGG